MRGAAKALIARFPAAAVGLVAAVAGSLIRTVVDEVTQIAVICIDVGNSAILRDASACMINT